MTSPLILCSILSLTSERDKRNRFTSFKRYLQLFISIFVTKHPPNTLKDKRFIGNLPIELIKKIAISPSFDESREALLYLQKLSVISVSFPIEDIRSHYANSGALTIPFQKLPQFLNPANKKLFHLSLSHFTSFEGRITQLTSLSITLSRISSSVIQEISKMPELKKLRIANCEKIEDDSPHFRWSSLVLEELCLQNIRNLGSLSAFTMAPLNNLRKLTLINLPIKRLPTLDHLLNLKKFTLLKCPNLRALPSLKLLTNLQSLDLRSCKKIGSFPSIESLISLRKLTILDCENLKNISEELILSKVAKVNINPHTSFPDEASDNEDDLYDLYYLIRFLA